MTTEQEEIRIRGQNTTVPCTRVCDRTILVTGKWLKTANVKDEHFVQGDLVPDRERVIAHLKQWDMKPDIFSFCQKITDPKPRYGYHTEWDDFAAIPITTYEDWFRNRIKKDVQKNVERALRHGVQVRAVPYNDAFVQGIKKLYDETPIRQGKLFWHYGKSFDVLKEIHGTYCERAEYLGAYLGEELIGFVKMVYVDNFAKTMHVLGSNKHRRSHPTSVLLAKAVEICAERKLSFFIYGEYNFPGKKATSLTEFKRRHGFVEMKYPCYFIPLTLKGRLALQVKLHRGFRRHLPAPMTNTLLKVRSAYIRRKFATELATSSV